MSDQAVFLEQDPASDRLKPEQVIDIHKAHRLGWPWEDIANTHGITRKQVQRIVQGRRWQRLHPRVAPEIYSLDPVKRPTMLIYLDTTAGRVAKAAHEAVIKEQASAEQPMQAVGTQQGSQSSTPTRQH